jgi:hypothetical protein
MARFVNAQVPEVVQLFWAALQRGEFIADAAAAAGTYRKQGTRWVAACGGVRPRRGRHLKGRCLSFSERDGRPPSAGADDSVAIASASKQQRGYMGRAHRRAAPCRPERQSGSCGRRWCAVRRGC